MKTIKIKSACWLLFSLMLCLSITSCEDDDTVEDETFSSDQFRILKVEEGSNVITEGETGVSAFGLSLEITFSHEVLPVALSSGLSISGNGSYALTLDETNSIATLVFDPLDYETDYTITLTSGVYGAQGASLSQDYSLTFRTRPFVVPNVTLSTAQLVAEEGESLSVAATLSESTTEAVTITLSFAGDAVLNADYALSSTTITIAAGELTGSINIELVDDTDVEGTEIIVVGIESINNGAESGTQTISLSLVDNDVATDLTLKGVMALRWSTETDGNSGKAIHLRATADIADLSVYSIGVANNGGGTDSIEYTFPAISVSDGDDILLARDEVSLPAYFGVCASDIEHVIQTDAMSQNGDDAIELFSGTAVIETYGDVDVDGSGQEWEYTGSWAYKLGDTWVYGGIDCALTSTTTQDSDCTYPLCANALQFQGIMSFEADPNNTGGTDRERAIHLRANRDIADLSVYGIGISNNGGGSDGREMDLPAISVSEGDNILFIRDEDEATIAAYFGACFDRFDHTAVDGGINFNGDDGVELYENMNVIEIYGDVVDDGTGLFWEYTGSWAFKEAGDVYTYGGVNCAEFAPNNAASGCPYPYCD